MALTRLKLNLGQIPALAKAVQAMVSVMVPCRVHARLPDPSTSLCSRLTPLPPCFQAVTAVPSGIFTPTLGWAGPGCKPWGRLEHGIQALLSTVLAPSGQTGVTETTAVVTNAGTSGDGAAHLAGNSRLQSRNVPL